jgi:hypothetical protein
MTTIKRRVRFANNVTNENGVPKKLATILTFPSVKTKIARMTFPLTLNKTELQSLSKQERKKLGNVTVTYKSISRYIYAVIFITSHSI